MAGNVMKGDASGRGAVEGYRVSIPARQRPYTEAEIAVVVDAMRNVQGQTQGAKQEQFQQDFAAFTGANHAFAVANGRGVPRDHRRLGQGRYRRPEGWQMCGVAARPITGGVLIPACSPCDERDVFLEDVFAASLAESLWEPLDGAYLCGGTGDGMHMRLEERKAAIRIGVSLCKKAGKCSLVQVGAPTMRDALELAAYAAECGADGISSVPLGGFDHSAQMRYSARSSAPPTVCPPFCTTCRNPAFPSRWTRSWKRSPSRVFRGSNVPQAICFLRSVSSRKNPPARCCLTARMNTSRPPSSMGRKAASACGQRYSRAPMLPFTTMRATANWQRRSACKSSSTPSAAWSCATVCWKAMQPFSTISACMRVSSARRNRSSIPAPMMNSSNGQRR